jgi:hypothetical protein
LQKKVEMVKLNLINDRVSDPKCNRIYDSTEDANFMGDILPKSTAVRISSQSHPSRKSKIHSFTKPDRFDVSKLSNDGAVIDLAFRPRKTLVHYGQDLERKQSEKRYTKTTTNLPSLEFEEIVFAATGALNLAQTGILPMDTITSAIVKNSSLAGEKINSPTLDFIHDRIHEDVSHTIQYELKSGKLPAPHIEHTKRVETVLSSIPGPGEYNPKDIALPHTPQTILNFSKLYRDEILGEIIPLKERLRRERQSQSLASLHASYSPRKVYVKGLHTKTTDSDDEYQTSSTNGEKEDLYHPHKLFLRNSLKPKTPIIFGSGTKRFQGKQPSYVKTSGMKLDPDYDKEFLLKSKILLDFSKMVPHEDPTKKKTSDIYLDPPDTSYLTSLQHDLALSPRRYAAVFRSQQSRSSSPGGLLNPENENLGPGCFFPSSHPPAIQIHEPEKPSRSFQLKQTFSRLQEDMLKLEQEKDAKWQAECQHREEMFRLRRKQREDRRIRSMIPVGQKIK